MSTQVSTKVRLVRCPRCMEVLAELPNVAVYKCGGCGITLEAKNRGLDANRAAESSPRDRDGVVEEKEARSLAGDSTRPPSVESSPDNDRCREDGGGSSSGLSDKNAVVEVNQAGKDDGTSVAEVSLKLDGSLSEDYGKSRGGSGRWSGSSSDVVLGPGEIVSETEPDVDRTEGGQPQRAWQEGDDHNDNDDDDIEGLPELEDEEADGLSYIASQKDCLSTGDQRLDSDSGLVCNENIDSLLSEEQHVVLGTEEQCRPVVASQTSWNDSLASFYLTCPEDELVSTANFERISSIDTLASSSELVSKYRSMNEFLPTSSYYGYDGSESSYDGTSRPEKSTELNKYAASRFITRQNKHKDASRLRRSDKAMSPSSYNRSLLPPRPSFDFPDKISYSEADKMDRLPLNDQLNRMQFPKVATGKFNPRYDRLPTEEELCYGASRAAFSGGEAANYWNRHGCTCLHCRRQDWHYLAAHSVHCWNSCCDASPQCHTSSELSLWGCKTEPDDRRCDSLKRKDKFRSRKQHLLPVAGGAPLVSCYKCWELLQIPVDFLLFERRCHRLKCNACCEVLKFSLLKGTHLVPYVRAVSNPPPSMADGVASRSSSFRHAEDAVSCSDHYRESFCRSSEVEVTCSKTESVSREDSCNADTSSVKNSKMKSVWSEGQRTNGMRTLTSAGPSSQKGASEIRELSSLHRLMGYSSPSRVFIK